MPTPNRAMTAGEILLMSSKNQRSQLFIAGLEHPPIVFSGQINQVFSTHDMVMQFEYNNVVDGAYTDIHPNMTIWIGTAIGLYDVGISRVRAAPTSTRLYVNESSEILFADDLFFTVVDEFLPWPRHVKIIGQVVYMDGAIAYSNQNVNHAPVAIMGCDAVKDVDTYPVTVTFPNIADSWVFDGTITAYLLTASQGIVTGETTTAPVLTIASYPTNGRIRVGLTVTASNGKTTTAYRTVYVYDSDHRPHTVFNLGSCRGDLTSGYWSLDVTMFEEAGITTLRDRAPIVLFARDWYGDEKISMGQLPDRENIVVTGWIADESIEVLPDKRGLVKFRVEGLGYWMSKMPGYPPGVLMAKKTPTTWVMMPKLTVDRAVFHLMHWHSTVCFISDVYLSEDARYAGAFDVPADSIWSQIREIAETSIVALPATDRFGRFFMQVDAQLTPTDERTWPTIMPIERKHWQGKIDLRRAVIENVAQLNLSGIHVSSSGSGSPYFALANGHVFKRFGVADVADRFLLNSQAQAIELAGLFIGWKNMELEPFDITLASNNRMFDIAPHSFATIAIEVTDTIRGIEYTGNILPRAVSLDWDSTAGCMNTVLEVEIEIFPEPAIKGDIPTDAGADNADFSMPNFGNLKLPDLPLMVLPPTVINPNHPKVVLIATSDYGVFWTKNFNAGLGLVEWESMNAGLPADDIIDIFNIKLTPAGAVYLQTRSSELIYRASALGGAWSPIASTADFQDYGINSFGVNPTVSDTIAIVGMGAPGAIPGIVKLATGGALGAQTSLNGFRYARGDIVFSAGKWIAVGSHHGIFTTPWLYRFSAAGAEEYYADINTAAGQDGAMRFAQAIGDKVFQWDASGAGGFNILTAGGTVVTRSTVWTPRGNVQAVSFSPTGTHAMGADDSITIVPYLTTDGGTTWLTAGGTVPAGSDVWENCKDNNRWIFGGGATIKFTLDHGLTHVDKVGNLSYVAPLCDITHIRYISG